MLFILGESILKLLWTYQKDIKKQDRKISKVFFERKFNRGIKDNEFAYKSEELNKIDYLRKDNNDRCNIKEEEKESKKVRVEEDKYAEVEENKEYTIVAFA